MVPLRFLHTSLPSTCAAHPPVLHTDAGIDCTHARTHTSRDPPRPFPDQPHTQTQTEGWLRGGGHGGAMLRRCVTPRVPGLRRRAARHAAGAARGPGRGGGRPGARPPPRAADAGAGPGRHGRRRGRAGPLLPGRVREEAVGRPRGPRDAAGRRPGRLRGARGGIPRPGRARPLQAGPNLGRLRSNFKANFSFRECSRAQIALYP